MTAMGLFGTLFDRWFNPIKVTKGSSKTGGVIDIMRRLRRGNCVLLFCEGRLSHNGRSTYIAPATAKLAKSVRCKVVTFRASGGFFIEPRWQNYLNRGKLFSAGVVHEYGAEELSKMTNDEVLEHIRADLYVDAYEEQERRMQRFKFKHGVRDVIRYYDTCPRCGGLDTLTATEERREMLLRLGADDGRIRLFPRAGRKKYAPPSTGKSSSLPTTASASSAARPSWSRM